MKGININDKFQDFTCQILEGKKTVETRDSKSLSPYLGQRIGLVRTGKGKATLVGYATISGTLRHYKSQEAFDSDVSSHRVEPDSQYYIKAEKYGYELLDVVSCTPRVVKSLGIVAREI